MSTASTESDKVSKSKVFLFGATGHAGSEILQVLTSAPYAHRFQVSVLVRAHTLDSKDEKKAAAVSKLRASGAHLVLGDVQASAAEIAKWIGGYDIVISALSYFSLSEGRFIDFHVLEAVKLAKVPWFIPSAFSSDVYTAVVDSVPPMALKKAVYEAVQASGVNYFIVISYVFAEYLVRPLFGVDITNATVTAPYSMQAKASTIAVPDIAKLTVEALVQRNEPHVKNQVLHFVAETVSYEDIARTLEQQFKKPFKRITAGREETLAAVQADTALQNWPARVRAMYGEQKGMWLEKKDSWNAQHAKHVNLTSLSEFFSGLKSQTDK